MAGRYTAYHAYQNASFQKANAAGIFPYTGQAYQCKHSQRSAAYQHNNMVRHQHFESPSTTCCDEPVTPLGNKPQWKQRKDPMSPTDCAKRPGAAKCNRLEMALPAARQFCAGTVAPVRSIRLKCHKICPEFRGGSGYDGQYGSFLVQGTEGEVLVLTYQMYANVAQDHYDGCLGTQEYKETFCGGYSIPLTLYGDFGKTAGCDCDCCGSNGVITPPSMGITGSSLTSTWQNTLDIPGDVVVDESCYNGSLSGTFFGTLGGSQSVPWTAGPTYSGSGTSVRKITGTPGVIGTSAPTLSTCCGGTVTYYGNDGCGNNDTLNKSLTKKWGSSDVTAYVGGSPVSSLTVGDNVTIKLADACSYTTAVTLGLTKSCLTNTISPGQAYEGYWQTSENNLQLTSTFACKGCCGAGQISSAWNNGCNTTSSKSWDVNNAAGTPSTTRGAYITCVDRGSGLWQPAWFTLSCDLTIGGTGTYFGSANVGVDSCVAQVDAYTDSVINSLCDGGAVNSDSAQCCYYANNGLTGTSFRAMLMCINNSGWSSAPICCQQLYSSNSGWVNQGSSTCCPN